MVSPVPIEERLSVLETRSEFAAEQADVRGSENRLILWILGATIALAAFFVSNTLRLDSRIEKLDTKVDTAVAELRADLGGRIEKLDTKVDTVVTELRADVTARMDRVDVRMDRIEVRMDRLEGRIEKLDEKLDARFDAIMTELRAQRRGEP